MKGEEEWGDRYGDLKRVRKDRSKTLSGKRSRVRRNYFKGMW